MMTAPLFAGVGGHHSARSTTDEWLTPPAVIEALGGPDSFDLDPCSPIARPWPTARSHLTVVDNGLLQAWFGRVWLNPPYGRSIGAWLDRDRTRRRVVSLHAGERPQDTVRPPVWAGVRPGQHVPARREGFYEGLSEALTAYAERYFYLAEVESNGRSRHQALTARMERYEGKKPTPEVAKAVAEVGREVFKGFFSDMREGLMNGKSVWESFGNAAVNALNRIAEKLIEMAAAQLFESAFGGSGGGSGGIGGLIGGLFGGGSSGTASGIFDGMMGSSFFPTFANGAAFRAGNVVPFAGGGIVSSPTFFPMSRGRTGLMGEAGPEAIMPLKRGPGGRLGVDTALTPGTDGLIVIDAPWHRAWRVG